MPATSARPVPPATVARPQWQRVVPPGPVVSTFLVADGQVNSMFSFLNVYANETNEGTKSAKLMFNLEVHIICL